MAVVVASLAAGGLVFWRLVLTRQAPGFDEAGHALQGALIASDIREGDLLALAFDTYSQVYWPPLHSWLLGGAFLLTGPSMEVARGVSVVSYVLLAPILFLLARNIAPRQGNVAGCLAAALALTSPGVIEYAAMSMLELPGILAISVTMLIYCLLERTPGASDRAHALLGLSVVVTYLVKTHFGILVGIAIVLAKLYAVRFRLHRLLTRRNLYAVLPLVLFLAVWFAWPLKIKWTWNALVNQPTRDSAGPGLVYTKALDELSGSWWMSIFLWTGLFAAWKVRARPGVAVVALLALTLFVIGQIHHTRATRHVLPMLPSMFVLTGVAGASAWAWLRAREPGGTALAVAVSVCIALLHAQALARDAWHGSLESRHPVDLLDHVSRSARSRVNAPYLTLVTDSAWPGPPVFDWILVSEGLLPVTQSSTALDPALERTLRWRLRDARLPRRIRASLRQLFSRYDRRSLARSLHLNPGVSQSRYEQSLANTLRKDPTRTIIVVIGSADTTGPAIEFIAHEMAENGFREVSVRDFALLCTQVREYRHPMARARFP